eukprot:COSAG03_NODE_411_length_8142_cov_5.225289_9_plen_140_part_00
MRIRNRINPPKSRSVQNRCQEYFLRIPAKKLLRQSATAMSDTDPARLAASADVDIQVIIHRAAGAAGGDATPDGRASARCCAAVRALERCWSCWSCWGTRTGRLWAAVVGPTEARTAAARTVQRFNVSAARTNDSSSSK